MNVPVSCEQDSIQALPTQGSSMTHFCCSSAGLGPNLALRARSQARTHLDDGDLASQQAVNRVLHPVGHPENALAHLDNQRECGRRPALQDTLLGPAGTSRFITCMAATQVLQGQVCRVTPCRC